MDHLNLGKQFLVGPMAAVSGVNQSMADTPNARTMHLVGLRKSIPHLQHRRIAVFSGPRHFPNQIHLVLLLRSVLPPTSLLLDQVSRTAKSCIPNIPFLFLADQSRACHFSPTRHLPLRNHLRCLLLPHLRPVDAVVKSLCSSEAQRVVYSFLMSSSLGITRAWVCYPSVLQNL